MGAASPRRKVFISIHRALENETLLLPAPGVLHPEFDDAGVIVCDRAGNEIDFIRDPHIAEHCNMMTGE